MTELVWDKIGDRTYQTGVDRGVLYLSDGTAAAWNGLTSVEEKFSQERKSYYLDGIKYFENVLPGDFSAQLKAFTYPDEFERINGVAPDGAGLFVHDQKPTSFGLSYRTLIGDDVFGTERGYKIHLLYNLTAIPGSNSYTSLGDQSDLIEFGWDLSGIPVATPGYRPTAHISLDSTKMNPSHIEYFEIILYGSDNVEPRLPTFQELIDLEESLSIVMITDNGNGSWTAVGPDQNIEMLDTTTFSLIDVDAVYLNADTYEISST
jgi:hypothetical protein